MKHLLIIAALLGVFEHRSWAAGPADDRMQAAAALKILKPWQETHARPTERFLHIVCWTPSDRELPAGHRDRLSRMLLHIQNFYADQMERNGFGRLTFGLQRDGDGRVVMHEIRGTHPTRHYETQSGSEIRKECLPALKRAGIEADRETIAIFCNLATWDERELRFSHKSPYYAGGGYRNGTAWQLDSPELDSLNLPRTAPMIRDGQYGRISLGKHNSIFIGGMAHELGHAFGLPHVQERLDEGVLGTALMGSGNRTYGDEIRGEGRGSFLTFAHAVRLASHPLFCGRLETQEHKAKASLSDLEIRAEGKAIAVAGTVAGEPPIYGVVAYFDPEGNDNYNQTSVTAVPAAGGRFQLRSDALVPGKSGMLRLIPLHANGDVDDRSLAGIRFAYQVAADGTPDLQSIQTRLALTPIVESLGQSDVALARDLAGKLKIKDAAAVAAMLIDPVEPTETPAAYRGRARVRELTSFKPDAASVGWLKPAFNRVPDASMLLESGGQLFATGIYAHAPARHEYTLGGKWGTLRGKLGIAAGYSGSVRFEIMGDGRRLAQSPVVRPDEIVPFEVDVKGIERLELITSPADDGAASDWGLWLQPQLLRALP